MADTINDLLVRITPEGIDETADDLDQARDSFEETADTASESAGQLGEFADRWQGAMAAITAGLIAGAAVLLSRVPVLGESMAGLNAIIDAFALRLDSVLRPALDGANSSLFDFANAVATANGPLGLVFDSIAALIGIGGPLVVTIGVIGSQMGIWETAAIGVWSILTTVGSTILSLISTIGSFIASSVAMAAALGALIGVLGVTLLEITGVLDAVQAFGMEARGPAADAILTLVSVLTLGLLPALGTLGAAIVGFVRGTLEGGLSEGFRRAKDNAARAWNMMSDIITSTLSDLARETLSLGQSLVNGFIQGMRSRIGELRRTASRLAAAVRRRLPGSPADTGPLSDLDQTGPGLVDTVASGMERSTGRLEQASGRVAMAADPRGQGRRGDRGAGGGGDTTAISRQISQLVQAMQRSRQETTLELDGKTVARELEPLIGESAVFAGTTQVRR